jgi:hypothetical protein
VARTALHQRRVRDQSGSPGASHTLVCWGSHAFSGIVCEGWFSGVLPRRSRDPGGPAIVQGGHQVAPEENERKNLGGRTLYLGILGACRLFQQANAGTPAQLHYKTEPTGRQPRKRRSELERYCTDLLKPVLSSAGKPLPQAVSEVAWVFHWRNCLLKVLSAEFRI